MAPAAIDSVDAFAQILNDLLQKASEVKHDGGITQAVDKQPFQDRIRRIGEVSGTRLVSTLQAQYAAIETASRNIMYELIVRRASICVYTQLTVLGNDIYSRSCI